jgi:Predicted NTPase (NACHT family)
MLAYTFMQQGKREMSREEVEPILAAPLQSVSTTLTPEDFLHHFEAITSGLLLERERGTYSFAHQTFQEYLAMVHVQENHLEHELLAHVETSWWHETILLFCAQADATAILQACMTQSLPSLEALILAIGCVEEARTIKAEVKEQFYVLMEQGIAHVQPERRTVIVEALLKRRLQQMFHLQGTTFVDASLVTCAEYQLFWDEQHIHAHHPAPDTWGKDTFPPEHGRDVVQGVGFEDANAFCHWLTERGRDGQSYRLPRQEER